MTPLRALRCDRLLTQAQLARRARVALRTVWSIEAGATRPRMDIRRALLRALERPLSEHAAIFGELPRYPRRPKRLRRIP